MNKRKIPLISILFLIVLAGTLLASCGSSSSPTSASSSGGSASDGQILMQTRCSVCHPLDRVTTAQKTAAQWKTTVDRMINNGAQLTSQEEQTLVTYLAQSYHP